MGLKGFLEDFGWELSIFPSRAGLVPSRNRLRLFWLVKNWFLNFGRFIIFIKMILSLPDPVTIPACIFVL
jgi:hypothetical protein